MIRDRLKRLARRGARKAAAPVGAGLSPGQDAAFAHLNDTAEGVFQLFAAASVSSWEVLLTDLGRALQGRLDEPVRAELIARTSDALVPTQTPVQGVQRKFAHALATGVKDGLARGRLDAAVGPLVAVLERLPGEVETGWGKTVDYLEPLVAALDRPALAEELLVPGGRLAATLAGAAADYAAAIGALPSQPALQPGLDEALLAWQATAARAVEIEIYAAREILVAAGGALPETQ